MATKIDYVALLKPIEKILKNEEMTQDGKINMVLDVIAEILKQAEKEN